MTDDSIVFRLPLAVRIFAFLSAVAFVSFTFLATSAGQYKPALALGSFAVLGIAGFLASFYSIKITATGISAVEYFRKKSLMWTDISRIYPKGDGFILSNYDGEIRIYISPQIPHFIRLARLIQQKRPDLWQNQNIQSFHVSVAAKILFGMLGLLAICTATARFVESGQSFLPLLFTFAFGVGLIMFVFVQPHELLFEGDRFIIRYLLRERAIHVDEIQSIVIRRTLVGSSEGILSMHYIYPLTLQLKSGRKIGFGSLREGTPALASSLQLWVRQYGGLNASDIEVIV